MFPYPLTNSKIQRYYQKTLNLTTTKDGIYAINLDEHESVGTHRIALYINGDKITYFESFGVDPIPKKKQYKL